jgi:hypothetical protein
MNDGVELVGVLAVLGAAAGATALSSTFAWLLAAICVLTTVAFFGYRAVKRSGR